ncbi:MAG: alpha/beta hydrolase [bacterium]
MLVVPVVTSNFLITKDNKKIAYDHYQFGHDKVIVIAHGFFNSKDAVLIQRLKDIIIDSYDVIIFDFRGHGKSKGLFTWTTKECYDLERVLEYAKENYSQIGIIGISYGAAVSIQILSERNDIATFIAISAPYDSMKIDYHFWNLDLENDIFYNLGAGGKNKGVMPGPFWMPKKKPIDLVDKITCPVLYIHGEKDWVTRKYHSVKLYEKTKAKKKIAIIKDGSHAEYLLRPNKGGAETVELIVNWLKETLF